MNFWDYAFLLNAIEQHDKATRHNFGLPEGWTTDLRNEIAGRLEIWQWVNMPLSIGEAYGCYVTEEEGQHFLTIWPGHKLARVVSMGKVWEGKRSYFRKNRRRMVYARDDRGYSYRGLWCFDAQDLVRIRRTA